MLLLNEICQTSDILKIIFSILVVIKAFIIIMPIVLIVLIIVDFLKSIIIKDNRLDKKINIVIKKIIICLVIFFIPAIITTITNLISKTGISFKIPYKECIENISLNKIEKIENYEIALEAKEEIISKDNELNKQLSETKKNNLQKEDTTNTQSVNNNTNNDDSNNDIKENAEESSMINPSNDDITTSDANSENNNNIESNTLTNETNTNIITNNNSTDNNINNTNIPSTSTNDTTITNDNITTNNYQIPDTNVTSNNNSIQNNNQYTEQNTNSQTNNITNIPNTSTTTSNSNPPIINNQSNQDNIVNAEAFINSLNKMSIIVEKDYKKGKKWHYSNNHTENTFDKERKNGRETNCAKYVSWALIDIGVLKENQVIYKSYANGKNEIKGSGATKIQNTKKVKIINASVKTPKELEQDGKLKPGDIMLWYNVQHINVYAGNKKFYDAGHTGSNGCTSNNEYFKTWGPVKTSYYNKWKVWKIIRIKD